MANMKHFSDYDGETVELSRLDVVSNGKFESMFPGCKGQKYDSFYKRVGISNGQVRPVTRIIEYKKNPSLHECSAKCMGGSIKGTCECRCGGVNHGVGSF